MEIRIQESGQVVNEHQFRAWVRERGAKQNPPIDITLPDPMTIDMINAHGGDVVLEGAQPTAKQYQSVVRADPPIELVTKDRRSWWQSCYTLRDWTANEIEADKERQRQGILTEIERLERDSMLNRGSRELEMMTMEDLADRLAEKNGVTKEYVLSRNVYYGKLKALDEQIGNLRQSMGEV